MIYIFQIESVSPPSWELFDDDQVSALLTQCQVQICVLFTQLPYDLACRFCYYYFRFLIVYFNITSKKIVLIKRYAQVENSSSTVQEKLIQVPRLHKILAQELASLQGTTAMNQRAIIQVRLKFAY